MLLAQLDQLAHDQEAGLQVVVGLLDFENGEEAVTDFAPARVKDGRGGWFMGLLGEWNVAFPC